MDGDGVGSDSGDDVILATQYYSKMASYSSSSPPPPPPKSVTGLIAIEDCCKGMRKPCVLDLKMGTRQYGLNPSEEKKASKNAKAKKSTTGSLGVRIGGLKSFKLNDEGELKCHRVEKKVGMAMTESTFSKTLLDFTNSPNRGPSITQTDPTHSTNLRRRFVELLVEFRAAFASQNQFRFFTSSLLLVYDADPPATLQHESDASVVTPEGAVLLTPAAASAKLVMIDFAFTYHVDELRANGDEDGFTVCDEGYLKGIDSLIAILSETADIDK
jgi:inositol-hexakisphosphate kinase